MKNYTVVESEREKMSRERQGRFHLYSVYDKKTTLPLIIDGTYKHRICGETSLKRCELDKKRKHRYNNKDRSFHFRPPF